VEDQKKKKAGNNSPPLNKLVPSIITAYKSLPHCFSKNIYSDLDHDCSIRVFCIQLQIILGGAKPPPIIVFTGAAAPLAPPSPLPLNCNIRIDV